MDRSESVVEGAGKQFTVNSDVYMLAKYEDVLAALARFHDLPLDVMESKVEELKTHGAFITDITDPDDNPYLAAIKPYLSSTVDIHHFYYAHMSEDEHAIAKLIHHQPVWFVGFLGRLARLLYGFRRS